MYEHRLKIEINDASPDDSMHIPICNKLQKEVRRVKDRGVTNNRQDEETGEEKQSGIDDTI